MAATGFPIPGGEIGLEAGELPSPPEGQPDYCPDVPADFYTQGTDFKRTRAKAFSAEYIFDPSDLAQVLRVNGELCKVGSRFLIAIEMPANHDGIQTNPESAFHCGSFRCSEDHAHGIFYRRPIPYTIALRERQDEFGQRIARFPDPFCEDYRKELDAKQRSVSSVKKSSQVLLPNMGPVATLSLETGFFVKTKYDVEFEDGMLTKLEVNRPSEVHAAVQIPLQIVRDIIAVPTDLIKLRLDYSTAETNLLNQQKSQLEAQEQLRKAIEDVRATRESVSNSHPETTP